MKNIFLIGNAHLDPVWVWRWQEGFAETKATFRSALDRLSEFDDFIFNCAGGQAYKWVEENCPEMFLEIKHRVKEGRWVLTGGWWVQPDCNIPGAESFARHSLLGQRYLLEKFGQAAKTGYNVDSFGHNGMLPQILKKSGMNQYVYMRPCTEENPQPYTLFDWEAPDGSRVLTFRIPIAYTFRSSDGGTLEAHVISETDKIAVSQDIDSMCFFGVGNHGGGPTVQNINDIHALQKKYPEINYKMSSPDDYFDHIRSQKAALPVVKGSQLNHAIGCYSAVSKTKELQRLSEALLTSSEAITVMGASLKNLPVPTDEFSRAWEDVLFNTFHDIQCGCCIQKACDDAHRLYGEAISIAERAQNFAAQKISWDIDTMGDMELYGGKEHFIFYQTEQKGSPVVVFNPYSFPLKQQIRIDKPVAIVSDSQGNIIPSQSVRSDGAHIYNKVEHAVLFNAEIPAMGYSVFWLHLNKKESEKHRGKEIFVTDNTLENDILKVEFDSATGMIKSLTDKKTGVSYLENGSPCATVIEDNDYDTWAHNTLEFNNICGVFGSPQFRVVEDGELCVSLEVKTSYEKSTLTQVFTLYKGFNKLEVKCTLNWQEPFKQLSMRFKLKGESCKTVYEIPFGYQQAPNDGTEQPCQRWADISGTDGNNNIGFALLNRAKYSFSAKENELRLTCVRSPLYADHCMIRDDSLLNTDIGIHQFEYAIVPHIGEPDFFDIVKQATVMQTEPLCVVETYHKGSLPLCYEGVKIGGNVIATAFKRAYDNDGYVLRLYEPAGKPSANVLINIPMLNVSFTENFGAFEFRSFHISDKDGIITEVDLLEKPMN